MTAFNILPAILSNSGYPGDTLLSNTELATLQDGSIDSSGVSVSAGVISIDASLFNRYEISEIRYYYTGDGTVQISTSQNKDVWDTHTVLSAAGYAYVSDFSGFDNWPEYVRVTHTVTTSAEVFEIQVINKEEEQGYWYDGSLDELEVDSNVDSTPSEIQIFNDSGKDRDIFCLIDVDSSVDSGDTVELSINSGGPYYGKYDKGIKSNREYLWADGVFSGALTSGTSVVMDPASGTGYYYSPVFDVTGMDPVRLYWEQTDDINSDIDWGTEVDGSYTIAFRMYNAAPESPWTSGQAPSSTDPLWGTLSGSLQYTAAPNNTILEINAGQYNYLQLAVQFNTSVLGSSTSLDSLGLEEAVKVSNISTGSYKVLYAKTQVTEYSVGDHANILSFFIE